MSAKIFTIVFVSICFLAPVSLFSQTTNGQTEISIHLPNEGDYVGSMDVEMGMGKKYEKRSATFSIQDSRLCCDFPKIGKMPGKITIELPIQMQQDGSIYAELESVAGVMKMPMGMRFKLKLETLKNAMIVNQELSFVMTVYGQFMGTKYPTTISFHGNKSHAW